MARDDKSGSDRGRAKFRIIEFELEGNNATLRDNIRDIVAAIGRSPTVTMTRAPAAAALQGPNGAAPTQAGADSDDAPAEEIVDAEPAADESASRTSKARPPPRSPVVLDTLDLAAGDKPLKPYLQAHAQDNDNQRYLLIADWLKKNRGLSEVTMDHIHTAYRLMGWSTPTDASLPLRGMKNQGLFKKGTAKGAYAINHIGEDRVTEALKKAGAAPA